jgi:uncharacterized protein YuzE
MKAEYERRYDAAYFAFSSAASVRQERLPGLRVIDYGADGSVVGVEFISVSRGLDLGGVPHAGDIEREARRMGLPILRKAGTAD